MNLSIKQKLRLAPVLSLLLFAVTISATYLGAQRMAALTATSGTLQEQRTHLQMLFRGINESLLTDGNPASVAISQAGIAGFADGYQQLLHSVSDPYLLDALKTEIGPRWLALHTAAPPFLQVDDMNNENDLLLARYGGFLLDGDELLAEIQKLVHYSEDLALNRSRQLTRVVAGVAVASLLGLLWLFSHLYRFIAVPLNELRVSMLAISNGDEELAKRIDRHQDRLPEMDGQTLKQEIPALRYAYQFMLSGIREHLQLHQEAKADLQKMNQELEERVDLRTHELQAANDRMRSEIVERKLAQHSLLKAQRDNARILEAAGEGIYGTDPQGRVTFANPAATQLLGWEAAEMIGQSAHQLFHHTRADGSAYPAEECQALSAMHSTERRQVADEVFWRKDGSKFPVEYIATPVQEDGRALGVVVVFKDISEKKSSEERIYRLAHYDVLTELPNRTLFTEQVEQAVVQTQRHGRRLAVLFLDLDNFKNVNDTLGHPIGDQLLTLIAERIVKRLRSDDVVSRNGGDEFIVLLRDVNDSEDVSRIAGKMIEDIAQPVYLEGHELSVTASMGISLYPQDGADVATLQRNADTAMYQAKAAGRGSYRFFTEAMNQAARERLELESELRKAIAAGGFELAYQPQVRLSDGAIIGVEALLRWEHPEQGPIGPGRFIPVAEESGLIVPIGEWVLRTACRQFRHWLDAGVAPARFSVNLSARQFLDEQLIDKVRDALQAYELNPGHLELELTESCVMQNPQSSIAILSKLKAMGLQVAVDDFGVAYSSLSYLKRLPINRLKINRSFIMDIPQDDDDVKITSTIIALAHNLGLEVIAEGVETPEQLAFLQGKHCDEIQGFLFSRPLSSLGYEKLISQGHQLARLPHRDSAIPALHPAKVRRTVAGT